MKRYNFNPHILLHRICGNDIIHPVLQTIFFKKNNAIATDGKILAVCPLSEISNLDDSDIQKLNGHFLQARSYAQIINFHTIKEITDEAIVVQDRFENEAKFFFDKKISKYVNYECVLNPEKSDPTNEICFNSQFLQKLCYALGKDHPIITPNGIRGFIKIRFDDSKIRALICPVLYD